MFGKYLLGGVAGLVTGVVTIVQGWIAPAPDPTPAQASPETASAPVAAPAAITGGAKSAAPAKVCVVRVVSSGRAAGGTGQLLHTPPQEIVQGHDPLAAALRIQHRQARDAAAEHQLPSFVD